MVGSPPAVTENGKKGEGDGADDGAGDGSKRCRYPWAAG